MEDRSDPGGAAVITAHRDVALAFMRDRADEFARRARSANTRRAYDSDWTVFTRWCGDHGLQPLPAAPETVRIYVGELAAMGRKPSTITRHAASIAVVHRRAGHVPPPTADPLFRETLSGIRKTLGVAPAKKAAAELGVLQAMIAATPLLGDDGRPLPGGVRDRALLLLGFAAFARESELAGLDAEDVREVDDGLRLTVRSSKTDQEGAGQEVGVPYGSHAETCPVRALRAWRRVLHAESGPLFRTVTRWGHIGERMSPEAVGDVVKRAAARAGYDPALFAGHSLRSGGATAAAKGKAPDRAIMRQGRWSSERIVRGYIRSATLFEENAAAFTGL